MFFRYRYLPVTALLACSPGIWAQTAPAAQALPSAQLAQTTPADLPPAPSAVVRPLVLTGGVTVAREQPGVLPLRLDDAIQTALNDNAQLVLSVQNERAVNGQILTVANALLPNLNFKAYSQTQEINLAAQGLSRRELDSFAIPGFNPATFSTIVKVNTTDAEVTLSQTLFNVPAYFLYRAARKAAEVSNWATLSARGGVVLDTAELYLQVLADQAQVRNAAALVKQDELVFEHAQASLAAGVGIRLDVLRAQVELQSEEQELVRATNAAAKDKIQLNRAMGQPAGQAIDLVDTVPFAELEGVSLGDSMRIAEVKRKDLRSLEAQLEVASKTRKAVAFQRLPTLGVSGFYGVLGETTGLYHGVFTAEGELSIPVFEEGLLRGQREVAVSQEIALQHAIDAKRGDIEADIRGSLLDVESDSDLVKVARSNVELAQAALDDSIARFTAGIDDNLPVQRAQTSLVGAETREVQAELQYNVAKLTLARNTGVVETQYRQYLNR